jgi:hypothetical protein
MSNTLKTLGIFNLFQNLQDKGRGVILQQATIKYELMAPTLALRFCFKNNTYIVKRTTRFHNIPVPISQGKKSIE